MDDDRWHRSTEKALECGGELTTNIVNKAATTHRFIDIDMMFFEPPPSVPPVFKNILMNFCLVYLAQDIFFQDRTENTGSLSLVLKQ
jgi:hypothetical protein